MKRLKHGFFTFLFATSIAITGIFGSSTLVFADVDYAQEAEDRKNLPIQSNDFENWPQGPSIGAEAAILMEANTGTILYAKNMDNKMYPASTTKILTSLVAIENSEMDEMVTFSRNAVYSIEKDSSNMGMDEGQAIPMEQCLYGILVYSANEVCNAVAEHIAGDMDSYVEMMNQKAAELGCTNSHFVTTNGLHDENHYTTAHDLALIACEFFKNDSLCKMSGTSYYHVPQSPTQPDDDVDLYTHNLLTKGTYPYEGYVGGKTGFTTNSRQTLVSCAERNGMKLICVIMKEESPNQFLDTIELFDYGFDNFQYLNVAENETSYTVSNTELIPSDSDLLFNSKPILEIDQSDFVVVPATATFDDLTSTLIYDDNSSDDGTLAAIQYQYNGMDVGSATIRFTESAPSDMLTSGSSDASGTNPNQGKIFFVNIKKIMLGIVASFIVVLILITTISFFKNYNFTRNRRSRARRKKRKRFKDDWSSWN